MHFLMANFLLVEPSSVLTSHNAFKLHGLLCTPCPTSFNCYATLKRATLSTHIRTVVFQVPISEVARGTLWHFSGTAAFIVQFAFLRPFLHTPCVLMADIQERLTSRELDLLGNFYWHPSHFYSILYVADLRVFVEKEVKNSVKKNPPSKFLAVYFNAP